MKTWWNWSPEKGRRETRGTSNWSTEGIHGTGNGKGVFFIWGGIVRFCGTGPKLRTTHKGCSSHSECSPLLLCHLWQEEKRAATSTSLDHCFKGVDAVESSRTYVVSVRCEWNPSLLHILLLLTSQLHHLPPPPLLWAETLPPVHSVPAPVCQLLYFARHCTVKLKMFSLFLCLFFMYYLCENYYKPVTVQNYVDNCVSWVPKLTLLDLQANWNRTHLYNLQGTYCITDLVMSTTVSILLNSTWLPCCPTLIIA